MKKDEKNQPVVECTASGLGVRHSGPGACDVDLDEQGHVLLNRKGMSVAPSLGELPTHRIPKRFKNRFPRARGDNDLHCFRFGEGGFLNGPFADRLELLCDSSVHGIIQPTERMNIQDYLAALAATARGWIIDED